MIRRDYLLRMIEQCVQSIMRIRGQLDARQYAEAGAGLDQAFLDLIGTGAEAVSQLSETELLAKLTVGDPTHVFREKSLLLVALLQEAGQVHAAAQREAQSQDCLLKALNLLLTLQLQDTDLELPGFVPRIEVLRQQLLDAPLPTRTQAALWRYYERMGAYAQAEDALFALLDVEPGNAALISEGIMFYERLLRLSDATLEAGNLPRNEVNASLAEVRALEANVRVE
ncbi:MAG: hypothetical protein JWR19_2984 [Pedosphaera sp.]|nr:hypothetical protein [Pedosphaera sp.]